MRLLGPERDSQPGRIAGLRPVLHLRCRSASIAACGGAPSAGAHHAAGGRHPRRPAYRRDLSGDAGEHALRADQTGVLAGKHVLVEKPFATTVEEAEELASLAAARARTLMVGHTFVFSPPVRKIKQLIEERQIGPIYYIETTRVNLGLFQKDVSVLWDLGPHDVSILMYWLDEVPTIVSARGRSFHGDTPEDVAFLTPELPSGILAQLQTSWLAPSKLRRTTVIGRQRMVVYDDLEAVEKVKIYDRGVDRQPASFGEFQMTYRSGDILSPRLDTTEPLRIECQHFLDSIRSGTEPDTGARSGVDIVRVIQAAERSMHLGGAPQPVFSASTVPDQVRSSA